MKTEGYQETFAEYLRSIVWLSLEHVMVALFFLTWPIPNFQFN